MCGSTASRPARFLLYFTPEEWSPATRLRHFLGPPYRTTRGLSKAISAVENHWRKVGVFAELLAMLREDLAKDEEELSRQGHSSMPNSRRYTAVAEAVVLELYSCLDGFRSTLFHCFRGLRRVQNDSTERLFRFAAERAYDVRFPEQIRALLADAYASWFPELRMLRTELSHGDTGTAHLADSGTVTYFHPRLGGPTRAHVIPDLEAKLEALSKGVVELLDQGFANLCSQLEVTEQLVPCGFFQGRMYQRYVAYTKDLSSQCGRCYSRTWFEKEPGRECPLRQSCKAYHR